MIKWKPSLMNDSCQLLAAFLAVYVHGVASKARRDRYEYRFAAWAILRGQRQIRTFLCTLSFRKISVASNRCWFSNILRSVSGFAHHNTRYLAYFLPFHANRGRFRIRATQYPLIRKRKVRNPWTAASGTM
jgi:hypothetical protein